MEEDKLYCDIGDTAIFSLLDEDLSNAMYILLINNLKFLYIRQSKKVRRKIGRMIRKNIRSVKGRR